MSTKKSRAVVLVLASGLLASGSATAQPLPPGTAGGLQPRPVVVKPQAPKLWTFADLKAEATGPTTARLAWLGRQGATHYVVTRDGAPIAEVPASTTSSFQHVDDTLRPGQRATYRVDAYEKRALTTTTTRLGAASPKVMTPVLPVEQTRAVVVVAPALEPPRDFTVAVANARTRLVRVQWKSPQFATTIQIVRDGAVIANLPPATSSYDDANVPVGQHAWSLRTSFVGTPGKPAVTSAATPELVLRLRPFLIIAAGDSIMWGQGLADASKFVTITRETVRSALKLDVDLVSFAHSGAILRNTTAMPPAGQPEPTGFDQARLVTPGEIPNSFPTILHQLDILAPAAVNPADVDLVVMDGCINDVGVGSILTKPLNEMRADTQAKCSAMADVLRRVRVRFPNASVVVTGYYPIVSSQSGLTFVSAFLAKVTNKPAKNPILADLATSSSAFESASNTALGSAVATVNAETGGARISFVPAPYQTPNAFGASSTFLWHIPDAGHPDEVFQLRSSQCTSPALATSVGVPVYVPKSEELAAAQIKCPIAAMGHPNRAGAQAYANAIATALQAHYPRWRDRYAQRR